MSKTYGTSYLHDSARGIERISNILMMNTPLPASAEKTFFTVRDNQGGVDIDIFETRNTEEDMSIDNRTPITTINMSFSCGVPKDTEVKIKLSLDQSGILHIQAHEKHSGSQLDTTFQLSNQMTEEEQNSAFKRISNSNIE